MGFSAEYRARVEEQLSAVVPIRTRAMFGGVGIYSNDLFFALIAEDRLYFKVGDGNREDFEHAGMEPFFPYNSPTAMGYYELPPNVLKKPETLSVWVEKALNEAAIKRRRPRKLRRKKQ